MRGPSARNPARDEVAVVGVGTTPYRRDAGGRSALALACDAARAAIEDAGLRPADIDGICGSSVPTVQVQAALGLPQVTWWASSPPPATLLLTEAVNAVAAGACTTALVVHSTLRGPGASATASADPFRRNAVGDAHGHNTAMAPESTSGTYGYCAWAARYLHEAGSDRRVLGRIAVNGRTNAARNPHALYQQPLSMDDYLAARMIREPLCMYDMDPPVDAGDAWVVTTIERARDFVERPVTVHASTLGRTARAFADQLDDLYRTGKEVVADRLWAKSDVELGDIDLFYPYDGFSIMAVTWCEALGWCKPREAPSFLEDHWDADEDRLVFPGGVPVNTHGGSLSEGATQGAGHVREAVEQLRGTAGDRQVPGARTALVAAGGFMWNATAFILRNDA